MDRLMVGMEKFRRILRTYFLRLRHTGASWPAQMIIGRNVRFRITDGGKFASGNELCIADFAQVLVKKGELSIGHNVHVGIGAIITCREQISLGDDVLIAEYVTIRDQDHLFGDSLVTARAGFATAPIVIGDNVWIGAKATITRGVTIGHNSVIGANAVVTCDIPANVVAAGIPARVIREIDSASPSTETRDENAGKSD